MGPHLDQIYLAMHASGPLFKPTCNDGFGTWVGVTGSLRSSIQWGCNEGTSLLCSLLLLISFAGQLQGVGDMAQWRVLAAQPGGPKSEISQLPEIPLPGLC